MPCLIFDTAGNLYGTTEDGGVGNNGIVFELTPATTSGGSWTETILLNFSSYTKMGRIPLPV